MSLKNIENINSNCNDDIKKIYKKKWFIYCFIIKMVVKKITSIEIIIQMLSISQK